MVGRFLARSEDSDNIIAAAGGSQQTRFLAVISPFEFVFGVEVADDLYIVLALTHLQFDITRLAWFYVEERHFGQYATVCHTCSGYQHIMALIHRKRLFQQSTPSITVPHIHIARFEVKCLQLAGRQHFRNREMTVIFRVLQCFDRLVRSDDLTLLGKRLLGSFEVYIHPVQTFRILHFSRHWFDTCRNTDATTYSDEKYIAGTFIGHARFPYAHRHNRNALRIQAVIDTDIFLHPVYN